MVDNRLKLRRQGRGIVDVGQKLVQLPLPLDAPDGQGVGIAGLEGVGRGGAGDQSPGQGLHGDEAHVFPAAVLHQPDLLRGGQIAEGELDGVVQAGLHGLPGHRQTVVGQADEPDLPLGPGLQHGLVQPGAVPRPGADGGVVELEQVHIVRVQVFQAGVEVVPEALHGLGRRFGGQDELVPPAGQGIADLFLAVGVGPGGVEEVDAVVQGLLEQAGGLVPRDPLYGQGSEAVFVDGEPGAAQGNLCHGKSPLSIWSGDCILYHTKSAAYVNRDP